MKLLVDVTPLDAAAREDLVQMWTEILRAELALADADVDQAKPRGAERDTAGEGCNHVSLNKR